jgi:hypothetical protein
MNHSVAVVFGLMCSRFRCVCSSTDSARGVCTHLFAAQAMHRDLALL